MWGWCCVSVSLVVSWIIWYSSLVTGYDETLKKESIGKVRHKRNIICFLGLEHIIEGLFLSSIEDIHKHDPMDIGDTEDCHLYNGVFRGLSTLTNTSALNVECKGDLVIFQTTLGMTNAETRYQWKRRVLYKFSGQIWTRAKKVEFAVEIVWNFAEGMSFDVTNTLVTKLDGFKFGFSGLGPLNPVVSGVVNIMSRLWSEKIASKMADMIKEGLKTQLNKIALPF